MTETEKKTPEKSQAKEKTAKKKTSKKIRKHVTLGNVYVQSTYNNTIVTISDLEGNVLTWSSAGSSGFKGARQSTPYAAQVAAENATEKAKVYGLEKVNVFVKGLGSGREQAIRGLVAKGLEIVSINDVTPIAHNGCRKRKARRV